MKINTILFAFCLLLINNGYAQIDVQVKYKSGELHNVYLSRDNDAVLTDNLISSDVLVTHDISAKSYTISGMDENNKPTTFNLAYSKEDKDGDKIYTNKGNYFRVADKMDSLGVLLIVDKKVRILDNKTKAIFIVKIINLQK